MKYLDFFTRRSTVRSFDPDKHISDTQLRALIEAASHAPNTGNMQLYSVVATRSAEIKAALAPQHFNQPCATGCDVLLTFCADLRRFEAWCRARDARPGFENFHSFVTSLIDTTIFAQQFVTLAELNGIGTCYLGTVTYNAAAISDILELPERVIPVITIAAGYPAGGKFPEPSDRIPVEGILHPEKFQDYTPEAIETLYRAKESLPESAKFIAENGKETLAQVFTDVRYPRELNENVSRSFETLLRDQRFMD